MSSTDLVAVRFAEPEDAPEIAAIVNHYIAESTANFRTEAQTPAEWEHDIAAYGSRYPWLLATVADGTVRGKAVGVAYAKPWNARQAYDWTAEATVYVAAGQRGRRVGSTLYRELLKRLEAQGFHSVMAQVTSPNPGSEALHAACGFELVGTIKAAGYKHGEWHDVGIWQKILAAPEGAPAPTTPVER
ncbi:N-acetyltransferase family protein [Glycomyces sp. TRM65418]|uniref:GNAT family N-acetyltransferase n=1 Tax=Glycomyces sp. TRM65418 TaxID=2867006 RepID=UPI001CE57DC0|nr:GNAT family N-acetyltransferase [Glycomyces sp. TRM65418]MCC3764250.1 N-acetyltransferase family protein [Glycomyces sp. TRM65418]QZD53934.1 GNAT family N-acetyltransferase [Glycomyces sp. TRM65418]